MTADSSAIIFLLVLAAGLTGWFLARWGRSGQRALPPRFASAEYFKGLNFLLNEEPDKAIEVFIRMAEVDSDTVETHFALGSLFRRRGEADRAIRIHQNLIARPSLSRQHRAEALYELAQDYLRAGLMDRAETILLELMDAPAYTEQVLHSLVTLYEMQHDWEQAIAMRRRLESLTTESERHTIAQYHCEQADAALRAKDTVLAEKFLKRAHSQDADCVRANLMLAQMAEQAENWQESRRQYQTVLEHEVRYAPEVLPSLARIVRRLDGHEAFADAVAKLRAANPKATGYIALAAIMDDALDDPVSKQCVLEYLRTEPTLLGLYNMYAALAERHGGEAVNDIEPLRVAIRSLMKNGPRYRCEECGFRGRTLYWQCPSCRTWNSTMPFHEVLLAGSPQQNLQPKPGP
ncbi:MAG TPA: lipopolysaccharide assembly protein LapB [Gammaproteobacteria bacterium]|nr:lipopolysaccharide assembly protein LapB [Gammaproteobacteria bacterium]